MSSMKKKIFLIYGGLSSEREVSVETAWTMLQWLSSFRYDLILVHIDLKGEWHLKNGNIDSFEELYFESSDGLETFVKIARSEKAVVMPLLHGRFGEDGTIQGFLETLGVPYIGNRVETSAISLNKSITKSILKEHGIPVVNGTTIRKQESIFSSEDEVLKKFIALKFPLVLKPLREGSSVGIQYVGREEELKEALMAGFKYDDELLIEEKIECREIFVSIIQRGKEVFISVLGEVTVENDYYTYQDKYSNDSTAKKMLASLPEKIDKEIRELSARVFSVLGGRGLMRVDFFLSSQNQVFVNEVNTLPSLQGSSVYPYLLKESGLTERDIVKALIESAYLE
ncbi:D-alanine--D-alanine ligase [Planococcaceae bacterium Storch 2/2-2]|nr:D-alanine--D-alanine ligase [Planococcaceae bacterium Storch 2/2-2]